MGKERLKTITITIIFDIHSIASEQRDDGTIAFNPNTPYFLEWLRAHKVEIVLVTRGIAAKSLAGLGFNESEIFDQDDRSSDEFISRYTNSDHVIVFGRDEHLLLNAVIRLQADPVIFGTPSVNFNANNFDHLNTVRYGKALDPLKGDKVRFLDRYRIYNSRKNRKR